MIASFSTHPAVFYLVLLIVLLGFDELRCVFHFTDTAEVIQSRLNEQEGREEFYVHYVGCEYISGS